MTLVLYRSGKIIQKIQEDQMLWNWIFLDNGSEVALIEGPTHGTTIGYYELYDTSTGKLIDQTDGPISSSSPAWTQQLPAI
jgi:hypothetical protein